AEGADLPVRGRRAERRRGRRGRAGERDRLLAVAARRRGAGAGGFAARLRWGGQVRGPRGGGGPPPPRAPVQDPPPRRRPGPPGRKESMQAVGCGSLRVTTLPHHQRPTELARGRRQPRPPPPTPFSPSTSASTRVSPVCTVKPRVRSASPVSRRPATKCTDG